MVKQEKQEKIRKNVLDKPIGNPLCGNKKYVYKIDEKGLPQIQKIETFGQDGKYWVVKSGLKAGDRVIVLGIQGVIPSRPVRELTQEEIKAIDASANAKKESDSKK